MKRSAALSAFAVIAVATLTACPADMWIPIETAPRPGVAVEHVQYLEALPTRPYHVIGILTPPEDEYDTEAELVKALRHEAAKHGADAIFIESESETQGWHFDAGMFGGKGGTTTTMKVRAKAIVFD